jgi:holin-like protein
VPGRWLAQGTRWLLSDMLLFFIPAMLVIINYGDLVRSQGLRIVLVIVLSTACVMVATALVVDAVYRLELRLAQRKRRQERGAKAAAGGVR